MNDFWKSVDGHEDGDDKDNNSLNIDDLSREENLPAVPDFSEAIVDEAIIEEPAPPSASEISLGNVEEAEIDTRDKTSPPTDLETASRRKPLLLGVIVAAVALIALFAISSSKPKEEPAPAKPAVVPSTEIDPVKTPSAKDPKVNNTEIDPTDPKKEGGEQAKGDDLPDLSGAPTPAQQAKATKLLDKVENWVKKADHPADGKTGKLRNNAAAMAALASQETGVDVIANKQPKVGQVRLTLNRRIGLCILKTPINKSGIPDIRQVKIYVTGINAR